MFLVAAGGPPDAEALNGYEQRLTDALAPWSTGRRCLSFMFGGDADPRTVAPTPPNRRHLAVEV